MRLLPAVIASTFGAVSALATAQAQDAPPHGVERVIVFFAWDRPVIDGDAAARLDRVASVFLAAPGERLIVSGHADRSGPAGPNLRSGRKRAEAVAAYLAARGIPDAAMTIVSHGETQPLIATDDGVREPQNRRVEIERAPGA